MIMILIIIISKNLQQEKKKIQILQRKSTERERELKQKWIQWYLNLGCYLILGIRYVILFIFGYKNIKAASHSSHLITLVLFEPYAVLVISFITIWPFFFGRKLSVRGMGIQFIKTSVAMSDTMVSR